MRLLVCGSREWPGTWEDIAEHLPDGGDVTIIHGACSRIVRRTHIGGRTAEVQASVDMIADFVARGLGFSVEAFPADWSIGRSAGPGRNARMLREGKPDRGIAFGPVWRESPGGRSGFRPTGTGDMVNRMLAAGLPVRWVPAPGEPAQDITAMPAPTGGVR